MKQPNLYQYAQLRTLLDSLEIGALRYYLAPNDECGQDERFEYLNRHLRPIVDKIWAGSKEIDCPEGYYDCNGCCVPYTCIFWSDE